MKKLRNYILIYVVVVIFMCSFSTFGALIPLHLIKEHAQESADYLLKQGEIYEQMFQGDQGSKSDRYADSIMLNMICLQDEDKPFESAMSGNYYENDVLPRKVHDFYQVVYEDAKANTTYTRYWHGSLPIIKVGLIFGNISHIYIGYAVILMILFIALMIALWKKKQYLLMGSLIIGAIAVNLYCVPFSLEYAPVCLLAIGGSLLSVYIPRKWLCSMLFIMGMLTCYFDFLTIETLAYTLPLFFFVTIHKDISLRSQKEVIFFLLKTSFIWIFGYGLAYLTKWGISGLLFGGQEVLWAILNAEYRLNGAQFASPFKQLGYALVNPLLALKPLSYTRTYGGVCLVIVTLGILLFSVYYLFRKEEKRKWTGAEKLILLLCLVPYIRFIVLNNHSSMHWFFTFRAQMITITGLMYLYFNRIDYSLILRKEEILSKNK